MASFMKLVATDALCRTAGEFGERYQLRGFDSVHLATSLKWRDGPAPRDTAFQFR